MRNKRLLRVLTHRAAMARIPQRKLPDFWIGRLAQLDRELSRVRRGEIRVLTRTPGKRKVHLIAYGDHEPVAHRANFNSAVGGRDPSAYMAKAPRKKPVILLLGPVHGHETEGLTGVMNLVRIMETGADLTGTEQPELRALGDRCRLLILPSGNPDGLARFRPGTLQGMGLDDLRFWGQGTWRDGTFCGWPGCKLRHPMDPRQVGFLGCYFNDAGVNPMHEEFFHPLSTEAEAILKLAQTEGPDWAVSLHSHELPATLLRPAYVPLAVQDDVRTLAIRYYRHLHGIHLAHGSPFHPQAEKSREESPFNLVSALYHISGTTAFAFECPHGTKNRVAGRVSLHQILQIQLQLFTTLLRLALEQKKLPHRT